MEAVEPLPEGWERVSSRSRPGQVSYLNTITGRRVMQRPTEPANERVMSEDGPHRACTLEPTGSVMPASVVAPVRGSRAAAEP